MDRFYGSDDIFFTERELMHLEKNLLPGEKVAAIASGYMDSTTWLIAVSNFRIVLLNIKGINDKIMTEVPLRHVTSVSMGAGIFFSTIKVTYASESIVIEKVERSSAEKFVAKANRAIMMV